MFLNPLYVKLLQKPHLLSNFWTVNHAIKLVTHSKLIKHALVMKCVLVCQFHGEDTQQGLELMTSRCHFQTAGSSRLNSPVELIVVITGLQPEVGPDEEEEKRTAEEEEP